MQVTANETTQICELVHELCGLDIDGSKAYLIETRLSPVLKQHGLTCFEALANQARRPAQESLRQQIIDAITTQETLFFRDNSPFEALQFKALPEMIDAKAATAHPRRLRLWSAASSTGQEAYSMAMLMHEMIPDVEQWDVQILATDVSDQALAKASRGRYTDFECARGLPDKFRNKYFRKVDGGWQIADSIRYMLKFQRLNLLDPLPAIGPVDIVFCRNVAIYFEREERKQLFQRVKRVMSPGGYLFVGASESLLDLGAEFQPQAHCKSTFYQPTL